MGEQLIGARAAMDAVSSAVDLHRAKAEAANPIAINHVKKGLTY
jgi:hypothetical protein